MWQIVYQYQRGILYGVHLCLASEGGDKKKVETYEDRTEVEEVEIPIAEEKKAAKDKEPAKEKKADEVNKPENTDGNE